VVKVTCGHCTGVPQYWYLNPGNTYISNDCGNCTQLGTPLLLSYVSEGVIENDEVTNSLGCYWQSAILPTLCTGDSLAGAEGPVWWVLSYVGGFWTLVLTNGTNNLLIFTEIADASWNCLGPNTFTGPDWVYPACQSTSSAIVTFW